MTVKHITISLTTQAEQSTLQVITWNAGDNPLKLIRAFRTILDHLPQISGTQQRSDEQRNAVGENKPKTE